jgi:hypothetical protein
MLEEVVAAVSTAELGGRRLLSIDLPRKKKG